MQRFGTSALAPREAETFPAVRRPDSDFIHRRVNVETPGEVAPRPLMPFETDCSMALLRKLDRLALLGTDEQQQLRRSVGDGRWLPADADLVEEGRPSQSVCVIGEGLACRYKLLADGRRQILGFLIPGDLCDHHFTACNIPDHSVALLTPSFVVRISLDRLARLKAHCPRLSHALMVAGLVDHAIAREWLVSIGQRSAIEKIAHLFCELRERYAAIDGVARDGSFAFPVNQVALGDSIGLSPVHVNRTLMRLREMGLIVLRQRRLIITDVARLAAIAEFNQTYLQPRCRAG